MSPPYPTRLVITQFIGVNSIAMIDWIIENKQWIFSGIGVAVLGWLLVQSRRFFSRGHPSSGLSGTALQVIIQSPPALEPRQPETTVPHRLTPDEITASIRNAPLLQQPDVARHYRGVAVSWDGELSNAKKISDDLIQLLILSGRNKRVGVFIQVKLSDYPGLALLTQGVPILLEGVIEEANATWISLSNGRISHHSA